jgi:hypothetical protein
MTSAPPLTVGGVAKHFGLPAWQVRRLFETNRLPEPMRVGRYRIVTAADLPAIRAALVDAGYLAREAAARA